MFFEVTSKPFNFPAMKKLSACIAALLIMAMMADAQTFLIVPAQTTIQNNGSGFSDITPINCTDNGPLFPVNTSNAFQTNINGYDFWSYSGFNARVVSLNCPEYVSANNYTLVRIDGAGTGYLTTDWWHASRSHCIVEAQYAAWCKNALDFTVNFRIGPGGGYVAGDSIVIYYRYDIFASGITQHEAGSEDSLSADNKFLLEGTNVLAPYIFTFMNPPGLSGWNKRTVTGTLHRKIGEIISIQGISDLYTEIEIPGKISAGALKDKNTAYFSGKIEFSVSPIPDEPLNPKIEFTVDIGSDADFSDPHVNGNEVFDPGDTYLKDGPFMAMPQNGVRDDVSIFGYDPWPDPWIPPSMVPCGSGVFTPTQFFEIDDFDVMQTSLLTRQYGPGMPSIGFFPDSLIFFADHFLLSYDDDSPENWAFNQFGLFGIPVNSGSSLYGDLFGKTPRADEVIAVDLNSAMYPSFPFSLDSLWDENHIHPNFPPNPDIQELVDDDLNGIKYFRNTSLDGFFYFSTDNEANFMLPGPGGTGSFDPASIYMSNPGGGVTEVVNPYAHLGLMQGTDINAFTFGWIWDMQFQRPGLALLFSVDANDPTTSADESGGLDPRMIYYSFLNGFHAPFMTDPLDENIDALTLAPHSYNGYQPPVVPTMDFGDAPDTTYPTLLINDGARHLLANQTWLGMLIDAEIDGQPNMNASGDDLNNLSDEDGVFFEWPVARGNPCRIKVIASTGDALFNGWIDFNGNGSWADSLEHVFADLNLVAGVNYLAFITPDFAKPGMTFARFRFSHQPALSYTGFAFDGEVEDYAVQVIQYGDIKWHQPPDTLRSGLHADPTSHIADDWICHGGVVTDIHWWGSYELFNGVEIRGDGIIHFQVEIYSDSVCLPNHLLQTYTVPFFPGFEVFTGTRNSDGSKIYKYDYNLPEPFIQNYLQTYWLSVSAIPVNPGNTPRWKWQEANRWYFPVHCGAAIDLPSGGWQTITWTGIPYNKYSDLAFTLTSWVLDTLYLRDIDVTSGMDNCYDANKYIIVAGGGSTFVVYPGGKATLIAGEKIRMLPGTKVLSGGNLNAYITLTGAFCSSLKSLPLAENQFPVPPLEEKVEVRPDGLKVYPNPFSESFTLEIPGTDQVIRHLEIFSMMGTTVLKLEGYQPGKIRIESGRLKRGVYILKVVYGENIGIVRVVKY